MNKKSTIIIAIIVIVAIFVIYPIKTYNKFIDRDEAVKTSWSNVGTQYQRRADLIPNLVNSVKGYTEYEGSTLKEVTEARAKATQITISADNITEENIANFEKAQGAVSSALGKLLAISERYPDLKASQQFLELQAQLEGTENRIAEARRLYNETTKSFNADIRKFPKSIIAGFGDFKAYPYFESAKGTEEAPKVEF